MTQQRKASHDVTMNAQTQVAKQTVSRWKWQQCIALHMQAAKLLIHYGGAIYTPPEDSGLYNRSPASETIYNCYCNRMVACLWHNCNKLWLWLQRENSTVQLLSALDWINRGRWSWGMCIIILNVDCKCVQIQTVHAILPRVSSSKWQNSVRQELNCEWKCDEAI